MGVLKSLVDEVERKKEELEARAKKKAAKKAAELAVEQGKQAVRAAVEQAGRSLKNAGASLEEALFGPESAEAPGEEAERQRPAEGKRPAGAADAGRGRKPQVPPRKEPPTAADAARFDREVDDELAALKRKLAGK
jgi:hypothetical protein